MAITRIPFPIPDNSRGVTGDSAITPNPTTVSVDFRHDAVNGVVSFTLDNPGGDAGDITLKYSAADWLDEAHASISTTVGSYYPVTVTIPVNIASLSTQPNKRGSRKVTIVPQNGPNTSIQIKARILPPPAPTFAPLSFDALGQKTTTLTSAVPLPGTLFELVGNPAGLGIINQNQANPNQWDVEIEVSAAANNGNYQLQAKDATGTVLATTNIDVAFPTPVFNFDKTELRFDAACEKTATLSSPSGAAIPNDVVIEIPGNPAKINTSQQMAAGNQRLDVTVKVSKGAAKLTHALRAVDATGNLLAQTSVEVDLPPQATRDYLAWPKNVWGWVSKKRDIRWGCVWAITLIILLPTILTFIVIMSGKGDSGNSNNRRPALSAAEVQQTLDATYLVATATAFIINQTPTQPPTSTPLPTNTPLPTETPMPTNTPVLDPQYLEREDFLTHTETVSCIEAYQETFDEEGNTTWGTSEFLRFFGNVAAPLPSGTWQNWPADLECHIFVSNTPWQGVEISNSMHRLETGQRLADFAAAGNATVDEIIYNNRNLHCWNELCTLKLGDGREEVIRTIENGAWFYLPRWGGSQINSLQGSSTPTTTPTVPPTTTHTPSD